MSDQSFETNRFKVEPICFESGEISLSDIDLTDERYKISFMQKDISSLAKSIKEIGLVCPPTVRPINNHYIIVSGFNRVAALLHNGETKTVVYKTKSDISEYDCLLKSIISIAFQRALTHAELIICVKRLYQLIDIKQIADRSNTVFNMELNANFIKNLLSIGDLPAKALELIQNNNLAFKSAKRLTSLDNETINTFLEIFSRIKASNNKQLEIILHVMEITSRDGIDPNVFFKTKEIQDIIYDDNKEPGIKTNELRALLFEKRFPTLFKTRKEVEEKISSLKFGKEIKLLPPENFESQNYSISFTAKNFIEYKTKIDKLNATIESNELKDIFEQ